MKLFLLYLVHLGYAEKNYDMDSVFCLMSYLFLPQLQILETFKSTRSSARVVLGLLKLVGAGQTHEDRLKVYCVAIWFM